MILTCLIEAPQWDYPYEPTHYLFDDEPLLTTGFDLVRTEIAELWECIG